MSLDVFNSLELRIIRHIVHKLALLARRVNSSEAIDLEQQALKQIDLLEAESLAEGFKKVC